VRNPHDPDAQWSTKGTIPGKTKEWVGYKTQVAETLPTAVPGSHAPTDAVITAIVTQPAITSDHGSINHVEDEWEREGLEKPVRTAADLRNALEKSTTVLNGTMGSVKAASTGNAAWVPTKATAL
jgi:hypothetical protein